MSGPAAPAPARMVPATGSRDGSPVHEGADLVGLDRDEIARALAAIGVPESARRMRASQIFRWIYHRGVTDFRAMTTIAKELRATLAEAFTIGRPEIALSQISADGTRKWLLRFADGREAETVFIPEEDRGTLCISSQVGCTLNCTFCHTGTQALVRNLEPGEILGQVLLARDELGEWPSPREGRLLSNIVLMGMGEPLYNFENVSRAIRIVMDGEGISLSKRRITLSTAGVVPMIGRVGRELGVNLAVSLHAARDEIRDRLVPLNRKWPIAELIAACRSYPGLSNARRITFEYVMLDGVNDGAEDARALVRLLEGIPAKVNLIPFNPWPGAAYDCSSADTIRRFAEIVNRAGLSAPVRAPRGRDIMAACGQLRSESVKARARERRAAEA